MLEGLIRFALAQRWFVLITATGLAGLGAASYLQLPIDAVPDITNVQVQISTETAGYTPFETEQRVTFPIETAMAGIPGLQQTWSLSRGGLSQVTVVFKDGTDIYFARQQVNQRIQEVVAQLPAGLEPAMGPISTGLGEIFMWTVEAAPDARKGDGTPYSLTDLREIQDWLVRPQMRGVPGVADVNGMGGYKKQYQVAPDPTKLAAYSVTFDDIADALTRNNASVGAGFIEKAGRQVIVRLPGQVDSLGDISNIVVATRGNQPIHIHDVAEVMIGHEARAGAASRDGKEAVVGTIFMLIGENSRSVALAAAERLKKINETLPNGVRAVPVYDRTVLVNRTIATVTKNLLEGALLVIAVLFAFLGNIRAALITALVIPLSMLMTFTGMVQSHISANLMSLGALDFGVIVDGAVVIVENCLRHLAQRQHKLGRALNLSERLHTVFEAASETRRALLFGQLIIIVVYFPIFALSGVEGKMFHPMAYTVVIALAAAMLLSFTFVPAMVGLTMTGRVAEGDNALMRWLKSNYQRWLEVVLRNGTITLVTVTAVLVLSLLLTTRMGREFTPDLNEGDYDLERVAITGTNIPEMLNMSALLEPRLKALPEVVTAFTKAGTAEIASDPMPPNAADVYIMVKPRHEWPDPGMPEEELIKKFEAAGEAIPGAAFDVTQPIKMRFNELIANVRTDIAVKVFGDDMAALARTGEAVAAVLRKIDGAKGVAVEQVDGLPTLTLIPDRLALARLGLNLVDFQRTVAAAVGGQEAGVVFNGDRRFDVVVRLKEELRTDPNQWLALPIRLPNGHFIQLGEVARLESAVSPNQISREDGKRRVVVMTNVRGRDIGSFVAEAQARIEREVKMPEGYWTKWGGTFEELESATRSLTIVVPIAFLLVFMLLYASFGSLWEAGLIFTGVPFAITGGIVFLWARGIPLSISAGIGFIALSGVAVLNGLVLISFIRDLRRSGLPLDQAVREGALQRLRPVLMTGLVASLGFVPMALNTGTGAEVQRPLATVVIGGILSATILKIFVLPLLYSMASRWFEGADDEA